MLLFFHLTDFFLFKNEKQLTVVDRSRRTHPHDAKTIKDSTIKNSTGVLEMG